MNLDISIYIYNIWGEEGIQELNMSESEPAYLKKATVNYITWIIWLEELT